MRQRDTRSVNCTQRASCAHNALHKRRDRCHFAPYKYGKRSTFFRCIFGRCVIARHNFNHVVFVLSWRRSSACETPRMRRCLGAPHAPVGWASASWCTALACSGAPLFPLHKVQTQKTARARAIAATIIINHLNPLASVGGPASAKSHSCLIVTDAIIVCVRVYCCVDADSEAYVLFAIGNLKGWCHSCTACQWSLWSTFPTPGCVPIFLFVHFRHPVMPFVTCAACPLFPMVPMPLTRPVCSCLS
jgi:hypothetical protein